MSGAPARALAAVVVLAWNVALAADVPFLSGRVVDDAEILSPATRSEITATLKAHEERTTNQVAVLTVPTIAPESIEEYAARVFAAWKLGQMEQKNGVLLVVVPKDRKLRIEVGYGLESALTDAAAGRIIRDVITPHFRAGDFNTGVSEGVNAIVAFLEGRPEASASSPAATTTSGSGRRDFFEGPDIPWYGRILLGAFIFGILGLFTVVGVLTPGSGGWFLYPFLIPFWAMFPIIVVGGKGAVAMLAAHLIGFPLGKLAVKNREWYAKAARQLKTKGTAQIGGFTVSAGGWSSGSGGSGGGFSGGGGSSGGGGASGSW